MLPTVALGALPVGVNWPERLAALGLDVVSSGVSDDDERTVAAAREAVPYRPLIARGPDASALARAGAQLLEGPADPAGPLYGLDEDDGLVRPLNADDPEIETVMEVARRVLSAAQAGTPSDLWVVAGPGLAALPVAVVEEKLAALSEGARQARLYLAKEQFDI